MGQPGLRILPPSPQVPKALLARFRRIPTPHISGCMNRLSGAGAAIRPFHKRGKLLGTAFTVRVPAGASTAAGWTPR